MADHKDVAYACHLLDIEIISIIYTKLYDLCMNTNHTCDCWKNFDGCLQRVLISIVHVSVLRITRKAIGPNEVYNTLSSPPNQVDGFITNEY